MKGIQLRPAGRADVDQVNELARRIWNVHYVPIIGQAQVDYMLDKMYSSPSLLQQMEEGHRFFFVLQDGRTVGYLSIGSFGENGSYKLHKFYIAADEQGKGIGATAFEMALKEFPDMKTIRLNVNRKNFKSINFYFKQGFRIETVIDLDIGDGYFMDDFVMLKRI